MPVLLGSLFALLLGPGCGTAFAQVPQVLHYQATLVEGEFPVEGPVDLEVAFFADSTGGPPLAGWTEARTNVPVTGGRISLMLGSRTPFPAGLFETSTLYLEVRVNGDALPRTEVASTAYALHAGRAEGVVPGSITALGLQVGAVTAPALGDDAVTPEALADAAVTTPALADAAVTTAKLAPAAVTSDALANGTVTSTKLGASAVVGSILADGAVTTSKLANGAVTAEKVATGAVLSSLNELTDAVRLVEGENVTITPNAETGTITIEADDGKYLSSRRWKSNVRPLDGLTLVRQLRGVRYEWIENGQPDVGLIAEEVGAVVPEVVTYAQNGVDAEKVDYAKLVALLIEAVKDQQAQIEADRLRLQELRARVDALEHTERARQNNRSSQEQTAPPDNGVSGARSSPN